MCFFIEGKDMSSVFSHYLEEDANSFVCNQIDNFFKDFKEGLLNGSVDKLCIAVWNKYRTFNDFDHVRKFFEAMYASDRLGIPLSGLLIIGY